MRKIDHKYDPSFHKKSFARTLKNYYTYIAFNGALKWPYHPKATCLNSTTRRIFLPAFLVIMRIEVIIIIIIKTKYVNKNRKCVKILNTSIIPHFHPYTFLPSCQPSCFLLFSSLQLQTNINPRHTHSLFDFTWLNLHQNPKLQPQPNRKTKTPTCSLTQSLVCYYPFPSSVTNNNHQNHIQPPSYLPCLNSRSLDRVVCGIVYTQRNFLVSFFNFFFLNKFLNFN